MGYIHRHNRRLQANPMEPIVLGNTHLCTSVWGGPVSGLSCGPMDSDVGGGCPFRSRQWRGQGW